MRILIANTTLYKNRKDWRDGIEIKNIVALAEYPGLVPSTHFG